MKAINIKIFPALNGDSFIINLNGKIILIDGGYINTYNNYIKIELLRLAKEGATLSHLIVSHIDSDHISGIVRFLEENNKSAIISIENIWHNSFKHLQHFEAKEANSESLNEQALDSLQIKSYLKEERVDEKNISAEQGSTLASLILKGRYNWNNEFNNLAISVDNKKEILLSQEVTLRLLSPNNSKLDALYRHWKKELYKLGYGQTCENLEFFDDAFEFLTAQEKEQRVFVEKNISKGKIDLKKLSEIEVAEDDRIANGSTIAFVLEYNGAKLLFLGDSHPSVIVENLKKHYDESLFPIKFDLIKISHHGSILNTDDKLLELIDSEKYIVSTNGVSFDHPDIETIAKLVIRKSDFKRTLFFNYPVEITKSLDDPKLKSKYNYELHIANGESVIEIKL